MTTRRIALSFEDLQYLTAAASLLREFADAGPASVIEVTDAFRSLANLIDRVIDEATQDAAEQMEDHT
ncbi:hypothetical protein [Phycicoccus avicenniae]|uniref:hypothetical protein n=1 Tax=Phycicoccus avicenniae TaxID=2828860 RepID=UPI003D2A33C6